MKTLLILLIVFLANNSFAQDSKDNDKKDEGISRPCPKQDNHCISKFFAEHSKCSPKYEQHKVLAKTIVRQRSLTYLPVINATATLDHFEYSFHAEVEDFYVDRESDKVVLVVNFKNLKKKSDYASLRFQRRGKEPVITKGTLFTDHGPSPLIMTASIPSVNNIRLRDAISFAYLTDPKLKIFEVSPSLFRSKDPEVKLAAIEFVKKEPTILKEFFATDAAYLLATYIQLAICDFGLEII